MYGLASVSTGRWCVRVARVDTTVRLMNIGVPERIVVYRVTTVATALSTVLPSATKSAAVSQLHEASLF